MSRAPHLTLQLKREISLPMEQWHEVFRDILEKRYATLRNNNPRFSLRALARMAQISPAAISKLLNRKDDWKISPERALKICASIGCNSVQINHLAAITNQKISQTGTPLPSSEYDILVDPGILTVLFSFDLKVRKTIAQLSSGTGLSPEEVEEIINMLLQRKLLSKNADNELVRNHNQPLFTTDNISSDIIREHHIANLEALSAATDKLPVEMRDTTSTTFTGSMSQLALVREEIRNFNRRIHAIMDQGPKNDEVFKLVVALAPVTAIEN